MLTIVAASAAALITALVRSAGQLFPMWVLWLIIFTILFVSLNAASAARKRRVAGLAQTLKRIVTGTGSWQDEASRRALTGEFGPRLIDGVEEIAERIRVLQLEKRRYLVIIEGMADGIITVDDYGRITLCNAVARQICNVRESQAIGMLLEDTDIHPEVTRLAYECMSGKNVLVSEIRLPGWPQRVINIRAAWYLEASTGADGALIMLHDLTEARRHELSQKEFVANVSHELKTPITAVRTTAEALLVGAKNDESFVDRFLNSIIAESDRLSALIEDLLDIARRDSGITKTEKSNVSMAEIINRAVNVTNSQALSKGITMEVIVPEALTGYCDELQTLRLVRNLVDNAVKYTGEGGNVRIEAQAYGSGVKIMVADTGIGIPQGEVDRVFERFYRVDKARSRRMGGTGLGLAIVKDIVDSHNGEIDLLTQLGKGSTFTVILPGMGEEESH